MKIEINKQEFVVNDNEFTIFESNEFCNLKILTNLSEYERLSYFLNNLSNSSNNLYITNVTHGGYIPIECSTSFNNIYLFDTNELHKDNITQNINTFQIENITEILSTKNDSNAIIFIENFDAKYNDIITNIHPNILVTNKDSNNFFDEMFKHKYKLKYTDYFIYLIEDSDFLENFKNNIEDDNVVNYDNLINFCVMVKNGGEQFEEMLEQNLPIIDRWTILDTGSTDGTIDVINKVLVGKKNGTLYQEEFINFRDSRNRLLDLAGTDCKFNVIFDDTYVIRGDLRNFLQIVRGDQKSDSFTINIKSDDVVYGSNRILKSVNSNLRYKYRVHEVINEDNNFNVCIPTTSCFIEDRNFDYMRTRTNERHELDLKLLAEEINDNVFNPRTYYYLGQTHKLMGDFEQALFYYLKRAEFINSGFRDELVDALFEASRIANFNLNKPWETCLELYNRCYEADNKRPESLYFIGIHYYLENNFAASYNFFKKAFEIGLPTHTQYSLKPILSHHFIPNFLTRTCSHINDYKLGYESSLYFLKNNKPESDDYHEILSWHKIFDKLLKYTGEKIIKNTFNKPVFIFCCDGGFEPWTGSNILHKGVGGSETYIIEMARYIQANNLFKTIVFCNTPNKKDEIFENTLYTHIDNYYEFINTTCVHTCVISRFSEYLPVTNKSFVENIYLMLHDLSASGNVISLNSKLKNIFCLTEWHCSYFTNMFPNLKDITVPFNNGTSFKFDENVNKIPFKFIYSSFPDRGLLPLLEMWPKIHSKEPKATLHIYCNLDKQWINSLDHDKIDKINSLIEIYTNDSAIDDYNIGIFNHGWVSKQELEKSWQSSDFWFYPCTFKETFCITALEAAITKTFVITNGLAGLENTVADRGITIYGDPNTTEWKNVALEQIFYYFDSKNKDQKNTLINKNYEWAKNLTWNARAGDLIYNYLLKNNLEYKGIYNWTNNTQDNDVMLKVINHFRQTHNDMSSLVKYNILEIGTHTGISLLNLIKNINNSVGFGIDDLHNNSDIIKSFNNNLNNIGDLNNNSLQNKITYLDMNVFKSLMYLNNNNNIFHFIFIAKIDCLSELYLNLNLSWNLLNIKGILGINYPSEDLSNDEYKDVVNLFIKKFKCNVIHNTSMIFLEKLN